MFPFRGALVVIVIGLVALTVNMGVGQLPGPASLTNVTRESTTKAISMATESISVTELSELLNSESDIVVLDVRSDEEWRDVRIDNTSVQSLPLGGLVQSVDSIDATKDVYLVCRSGNRSLMAQMLLKSRGIESINVDGGMLAWEAAGFSTVSGE